MQAELPFTTVAPSPSLATIQARFEEFHRLNPWVYTKLVSMARSVKAKGHKRIGMKTLFEVLRWRFYEQTFDPASRWHLNNSYTSRYARLIEANELDLQSFFETRELLTA